MRPWSLMAAAVPHAALLAALLLWQTPRRPVTLQPPQGIEVRLLLAAPARTLNRAHAAPALSMPTPPLIAAPSWQAAAAPAAIESPPGVPAPVAAPPGAAPAAMHARAPAPEPEYHAALPANRDCAAQNVARHYPPMLRERGIEGSVLLRVHVDEQGRATEIQVRDGSGYRLLDEAARRVTEGCHFLPARRGELPTASWVEYPVRFALN